jgi:hypothetical protein
VYGVPLEALARDGGGWYRQGLRRGDADAYLLWVRDFLRAQYTLTYTPTKPAPAGKWRNVKVQVKGLEGRKGVRTVAPTGYFAP